MPQNGMYHWTEWSSEGREGGLMRVIKWSAAADAAVDREKRGQIVASGRPTEHTFYSQHISRTTWYQLTYYTTWGHSLFYLLPKVISGYTTIAESNFRGHRFRSAFRPEKSPVNFSYIKMESALISVNSNKNTFFCNKQWSKKDFLGSKHAG